MEVDDADDLHAAVARCRRMQPPHGRARRAEAAPVRGRTATAIPAAAGPVEYEKSIKLRNEKHEIFWFWNTFIRPKYMYAKMSFNI